MFSSPSVRDRRARRSSGLVLADAPSIGAPTLSPLVFGTLRLHETEDPFALLTEAWNLGITSFDCAAVYGGGRCEEILGAWLRDAAPAAAKSGAVVVTKGGCGAPDTSWAPRLAYRDLRAELDASLAKLGRIDLYLLHRDDPSRPVAEIVRSANPRILSLSLFLLLSLSLSLSL